MSGHKRFLTRSQTAARYQKTSRTLARWTIAPPNGFPPPVVVAGRYLWDEDELEAWERQCASHRIPAQAAS